LNAGVEVESGASTDSQVAGARGIAVEPELVDESTDFDVVRVLPHKYWHSEEHRRYEKTETSFHRAIRSAAVVRTEMNAEERIAENRALHRCARPVSVQKPISSQVPVPGFPGFPVSTFIRHASHCPSTGN
jgi:hypothetical protein